MPDVRLPGVHIVSPPLWSHKPAPPVQLRTHSDFMYLVTCLKAEVDDVLIKYGIDTSHVELGDCTLTEDVPSWSIKLKIPILYDDYVMQVDMNIVHNVRTTLQYYIQQHVIGLSCINSRLDVEFEVSKKEAPKNIKVEFSYEKEDNTMFIPEVKEIVHRTSKRGEFFTVVWKDDTTTTVKRMEGDVSDEYTAYLYALGKKLFGDKGAARKFITEKKKVFEDRIEAEAKSRAVARRQKALEQSLAAEGYIDKDYARHVYDSGFVPPCAMNAPMFKRQGRKPIKKSHKQEETEK